jgi:FkbM family methyltransferase
MLGNEFKVIALHAHMLYQRAYTLYKLREASALVREPLDFLERRFYLQLRPALVGVALVVYDVGAASGVLSGCLAKLANVKAVQAFEPLPSAFAELAGRMKRYPHVTCHNVALGDNQGRHDMWVIEGCRDSISLLKMKQLHKDERPGVSYNDHAEQVTVVRLDDYVREKGLPQPDVVKMDVQGYEDRVLRGGQATIFQAEYCILEISLAPLYEGSPLFDDIYRQMHEMGFRLIGIGGELYGQSGRQLQVDGIFQNEQLARDGQRGNQVC